MCKVHGGLDNINKQGKFGERWARLVKIPIKKKNEGYVGRGIEVLLSYYQVDQNYQSCIFEVFIPDFNLIVKTKQKNN